MSTRSLSCTLHIRIFPNAIAKCDRPPNTLISRGGADQAVKRRLTSRRRITKLISNPDTVYMEFANPGRRRGPSRPCLGNKVRGPRARGPTADGKYNRRIRSDQQPQGRKRARSTRRVLWRRLDSAATPQLRSVVYFSRPRHTRHTHARSNTARRGYTRAPGDYPHVARSHVRRRIGRAPRVSYT